MLLYFFSATASAACSDDCTACQGTTNCNAQTGCRSINEDQGPDREEGPSPIFVRCVNKPHLANVKWSTAVTVRTSKIFSNIEELLYMSCAEQGTIEVVTMATTTGDTRHFMLAAYVDSSTLGLPNTCCMVGFNCSTASLPWLGWVCCMHSCMHSSSSV